MKELLKKLGLQIASLLIGGAALILVLVGGNQSVPNQKVGGLTNYDELALNGVKSYQPLKLSITDGTSVDAVITNGASYTKWIDVGNALLTTSGTTTASSYRIQATATSSSATLNGLALILSPNLLDETFATSSGPQQRVASSTPSRFIPLLAGQSVVLTIRGTYAIVTNSNCFSGGCQAATSTLRGLGNIELFLDTFSTSTTR